MKQNRFTIAGLMIAVAFFAADCTVALVPGLFAGGLLIGLALQAGLYFFTVGHGRRRRFWAGFEAAGLAALLVYEVGIHVFFRTFVGWPLYLFGSVRGVLAHLPSDATNWIVRHVYIVDPNGNLTVIQRLAMFELAFGVPMVLLAASGGLMAAFIGSRRGSPSTTPLVISRDPGFSINLHP